MEGSRVILNPSGVLLFCSFEFPISVINFNEIAKIQEESGHEPLEDFDFQGHSVGGPAKGILPDESQTKSSLGG
jgi:hypothetical protein